MITILVILGGIVAMAVPAWLLYHFGASAWYWHLLVLAAALVLGLMPTPTFISGMGEAGDMVTGVIFVFLMVWGIGGLAMFRPHHREKHA